jgi:glutamine---fructose-6-phosphate transaminase (isomerizing)
MCGIFGFVCPAGTAPEHVRLQRAIRSFVALSEPRGRDATGVALVLAREIAVYRRPMAPSRVLAHPDFQRFLDGTLPAGAAPAPGELAGLGHCRLVTNGTQILEHNNQPVLLDEVVGVHNGIVTNPQAMIGARAGAAPDGEAAEDIALDSAVLFRSIGAELAGGAGLPDALRRTYQLLEGEASIAMFARERNALALATNTGSLFFTGAGAGGAFLFASEAHILREMLRAGDLGGAGAPIAQLAPGRAVTVDLATGRLDEIDLRAHGTQHIAPSTQHLAPSTQHLAPSTKHLAPSTQHLAPSTKDLARDRPVVDRTHDEAPLRRCTRCILPATYPFITFDRDGVCNHCHEHVTQVVAGREALLAALAPYRSRDGSPDCIVGFSGGRDSSYGLHLLKTELGMTPLAFTYDWGLVTDLARRNQARICGTLGIEHVIRAADIAAQRRYIRRNIEAWLARPRLGMVPLIMAGDKFFYSHARALKRETGIRLVVFCAGNELERTPFKTGFAGVRENNYSNRLFGLGTAKKARLAAYYALQFAANPRYLNESLVNSLKSFHATFVGVDDFLYLYTYEPWDEATIDRTLRDAYAWETSPESSNTWRIGDGYTAFINYIYHRVAGFTEFDAFRSHQIRDGVIDRATGEALAAIDNVPRLGELREFARVIGFNLEEVLARIDEIPRIVPRA